MSGLSMISISSLEFFYNNNRNRNLDYKLKSTISSEDYYTSMFHKDLESLLNMEHCSEMMFESLYYNALSLNSVELLKKVNSTESVEFQIKHECSLEELGEKFKEGVKKAWEFIKKIFQKIWDTIKSFFKWLVSKFKKDKPRTADEIEKAKDDVKKIEKIIGIPYIPPNKSEILQEKLESKKDQLAVIKSNNNSDNNNKINGEKRIGLPSSNKSEPDESFAQEVARNLAIGKELYGASEKLIFPNSPNGLIKNNKFNMSEFEKLMNVTDQKIVNYSKYLNELGSLNDKVDGEYFKKIFKSLKQETKFLKSSNGSTTNGEDADNAMKRAMLDIFGNEGIKKYDYSAAEIIKQIPTEMGTEEFIKLMNSTSNKFNEAVAKANSAYDTARKKIDSFMDNFDESARTQLVNLLKILQTNISFEAKVIMKRCLILAMYHTALCNAVGSYTKVSSK